MIKGFRTLPEEPTKIEPGPARLPIVRSEGSTPSERYLAKLADKSFLNLWSYPNTYIDKRVRGKGDGKELCDLLVVCGDHILIFSDKTIEWPDGDEELAWKRWYKRAIAKSVDQIRGAERWISKFPERIFIDRECRQPLPIKLPPQERRKIHGVVVALGAGNACKRFFGEGIGSLFVVPHIKGEDHWKGESVLPFVVGDVDPTGAFVHVLDEATLDIVLGEFDTIVDLTAYLSKKEKLIRSGILISAAGEEELVAYYITHMNSLGEHDFVRPDGSDFIENDGVSFGVGLYGELLHNQQYQAKKVADKSSYVWDTLIEQFTTHMLAGTSVLAEGEEFELSELEQGIHHMALVPRYKRRLFGEALLDAFEKAKTTDRFTRAMLPGPTEKERHTGFFFMTLAIPNIQLEGGYEQYRKARRHMLKTYAYAFLEKYRNLVRIIGIATEPPHTIGRGGSSEDLIFIEPKGWPPEFLKELEEAKKALNIVQQGQFTEREIVENEFPDIQAPQARLTASPNRKQRRILAARSRKKRR